MKYSSDVKPHDIVDQSPLHDNPTIAFLSIALLPVKLNECNELFEIVPRYFVKYVFIWTATNYESIHVRPSVRLSLGCKNKAIAFEFFKFIENSSMLLSIKNGRNRSNDTPAVPRKLRSLLFFNSQSAADERIKILMYILCAILKCHAHQSFRFLSKPLRRPKASFENLINHIRSWLVSNSECA